MTFFEKAVWMRRLLCLLSIMTALCAVFYVPAKKTQLKLKSPGQKSVVNGKNARGRGKSGSPEVNGSNCSVEADSLLFESISGKIMYSGFDKPYNSRTESFLITNSSDTNISGVTVQLTYNDMSGRMIHSRTENIMVDVPAGETRYVSVKSFDTNSTLYYKNSKAPRKGGQPFNVTISTVSIYVPEIILTSL